MVGAMQLPNAAMVPLGQVRSMPRSARSKAATLAVADGSVRGLLKLANLGHAAKARKQRTKGAVCPDLASWPSGQLECSELCLEGRSSVRSWAVGEISGPQCLLRLERCSFVLKLLENDCRSPDQEEDEASGGEAALWAIGCMSLGGSDERFKILRRDLDTKSPSRVLQDAWEAIERETAADASMLELDEVNAALRRLSNRAERRAWDPGSFLRVQVWRELVGVLVGGELVTEERVEAFDDKTVLEWMLKTDEDARLAAQCKPADEVKREAERLLEYANMLVQMGVRLKKAMECWQRFDAYRVLGVSKRATLSEIKKAFYKKALILHPDKGGDKAAFQELQRAYDEIMEERKRAAENGDVNDDSSDDEPWPAKPPPPPPAPKFEATIPLAAERLPERPEESLNAAYTEDLLRDPCDRSFQEMSGELPRKSGEQSPQHLHEHVMDEDVKLTLEQCTYLSRSASAAAARAGEVAVEVLKHCYSAMDALEEDEPDLEHACACLEQALEVSKSVDEIARSVNIQMEELMDLLEQRPNDWNARKNSKNLVGLPDAEDSGSEESSVAGELLEAVGHVADVLNESSQTYVRTVASAFAALAGQMLEPDNATADVHAAVESLIKTTKVLAVAAFDAAMAAAKSVGRLKQSHSMEAPNEEIGREDEVEADREAEAEEQKSAETPKNSEDESRTQESLAEISEALHMLRVTNRELLRLQKDARDLASRDARTVPEVAIERRERAFALLAEFLDQACLSFHSDLRIQAQQDANTFVGEVGRRIVGAAAKSFGFLLRSSAELAMPFDARSQTLRAALSLNASHVRGMVNQILLRLESSVTAVMTEGGLASDEGSLPIAVGKDMALALESVQGILSEAVVRLGMDLVSGSGTREC